MPAIRKPLRTKNESIAIQANCPALQMREDSDWGQKWLRSTSTVATARRPSSSWMWPRKSGTSRSTAVPTVDISRSPARTMSAASTGQEAIGRFHQQRRRWQGTRQSGESPEPVWGITRGGSEGGFAPLPNLPQAEVASAKPALERVGAVARPFLRHGPLAWVMHER